MRALYLLMVSLLLAACCRFPGPASQQSVVAPVETAGAAAAPDAASDAPAAPAPVVTQPPLGTPVEESAESLGDGALVCRKDADVRTVEIHMLEDGRCMLVYDNRMSGNGTQNALASRVDCETQQQRMKQNFLRSGFSCR